MAQDTLITHDNIAESRIIGTILQKPEFINHSEFMHPSMFDEEKYSALYWVVSELVNSGVNEVDDLSIIHKIKSNDSLSTMFEEGGVYNIRETIGKLKMLATNDVEEYLRSCRKVATIDFREQVHYKLENLQSYVLETDDDINDINYKINSEVMEVGENYLVHNKAPLVGDIVDDIWENLKNKRKDGDIIGHLSKFPTINDYLTYEEAELVVLGGKKKSGKSIVLMNEAYHKAKQGVPTLVLDTELSDEQYIGRLISLVASVKAREVKDGSYDDTAEERINKAIKEIEELPLAHIYLPNKAPNWSFRDLYSFAKLYQQKMGMKFLVFDYIKADNVSSLNVQEHNYLGDLTNTLKNDIAGRLNISCLAAAQMSPYEMRVSDSDKINRYASTIMYWMKKSPNEIIDDGKESGTHKLYIDFNRLGRQFDDPETEYINMYADLDYMRIEEAEIQVLDRTQKRPWEIDE